MQSIYHDCKVHRVMDSKIAADTGTVESDPVATGDLDGVAFAVSLGDMTSGATVTAKVTGRVKAGEGAWLDVPDAEASLDSDGTDDEVMLVELRRPNPWAEVRLEITRADQNAEIDGVLALAYRPQSRPVTQPDEVSAASYTLGGYPQ